MNHSMNPISRKGCLLLISGLPLSGKTFLTNQLIQCSPLRHHSLDGCVFLFKVSLDELMTIRDQSVAIQKNGFWRQFRRRVLFATKHFVRQLIDHNITTDYKTLDSNEVIVLEAIHRQNKTSIDGWMNASQDKHFVVIIDDNLYYKSMRYEWFQTSRHYSLGFAIIAINCSLDLALNRNRLRDEDNRLPEDVIIKMCERFECPQRTEAFERRTYFLCADFCGHHMSDELIHFIVHAISDPVIDTSIRSPFEEQLRRRLDSESKNNLIHKIDCLLRQIINEIIVETIDDKTNVAKSLSDCKKCLICDLKETIGFLPQTIVKELSESEPAVGFSPQLKLYFKSLLLENI